MVLFRSVENTSGTDYQLVVENDQWKTTSAQYFSIVAQVATIGWKVQMCLVSHIGGVSIRGRDTLRPAPCRDLIESVDHRETA